MQVATPESPPICLHTDSEGAQALASTEGTKRSKHIDVRYHHIRDLQSLALVSVEGIRSQDNPADELTKIQSTLKHGHFLHLINMDRNHLHPTSDGKAMPLCTVDFPGVLIQRAYNRRLVCLLFGFSFICLILYAILCVFRAFDPDICSFEGGVPIGLRV